MIFDSMGNVIGYDEQEPVYTDSPEPNILQVDYYRKKVEEFQKTLVLLDETGDALYSVMDVVMQDDVAYEEWFAMLTEFNTKREQYKMAAEAINLASSGVNALGVQFPTLQIPIGLGNPALIGLAAAVAVTAALIIWARQFWQTVRDALKRWQYLDALRELPPEEQAAAIKTLADAESRVEVAEAQSSAGTLGSFADIVKWVAIGGAVYLAYKTFGEKNGYRKKIG